MTENPPAETPPKVTPPSVDEALPMDAGGPIARSGFNYQDEIAVSFLIEMLETPSLLKVHCETHDDVVLVRAVDGSPVRVAEFVQVKASELDKLWSIADLCSPKKGKDGTSLFEISLARDRCIEKSRFRLVTLRPVVSDLKMLTFPFDGAGRETGGERFKTLQADLDNRFPALKSSNGNGSDYWLQNCFWDQRHSEEAVRRDNLIRIMQLSVKSGRPLLPEPAGILLDELRAKAKAAGAAKWVPDREKKIITRDALGQWWERRTSQLIDGASEVSGGKLREKMVAVGLGELVGLAADVRLRYAAVARTSRYMDPGDVERLQDRVKSELISLQAGFVAGQIELDGAGFHALCLTRMDKVNADRAKGSEDRSAFLKGCMYDIVDRCLLRFARVVR